MGASFRRISSVWCFITVRLVVAVANRYIRPEKTDLRRAPSRVTSLVLRSFNHAGHERDNIGTAFVFDAKCVEPISVFCVISFQEGSIKFVPVLLPVVDDRP